MALDNTISVTPIELQESNMFANGNQIVFADGTGLLTRTPAEYVPSEPDDYHTVKIDDTITGITNKRYQNKVDLPSHWWWLIADANNIMNPLDLSAYVGKEIIIPNILNFKLKR